MPEVAKLKRCDVGDKATMDTREGASAAESVTELKTQRREEAKKRRANAAAGPAAAFQRAMWW